MSEFKKESTCPVCGERFCLKCGGRFSEVPEPHDCEPATHVLDERGPPPCFPCLRDIVCP